MRLKDGSEVSDPRLDRLYEEDWRSLNYLVAPRLTAIQATKYRSYTWAIPGDVVLDQGNEGACVGFGWTHELLARPSTIPNLGDVFARERVYWPAQAEDEWPGGAYPGAQPRYEGTSVLAGAKVCHRLGYFSEYRWAMSTDELALAIGYKGPAVIGVDWYSGMFDTDDEGFIHPTGSVEGGHCVVLNRVKIVRSGGQVDRSRSYLAGVNSWGPRWGKDGKFAITLEEFDRLVPGSDLCIPMFRKTPKEK